MRIAPVSDPPKGRALPSPPAFSRMVESITFSVLLFGVVVSLIVYGAFVGAQSMGYNWQWYRIPAYFYTVTEDGFQWGEICTGLVRTLMLSGTAFTLAVVLGLIVTLLRLSGLVVGTGLAIGFLEAIRNIPLLVLLYLFYYVLGPIFGFDRFEDNSIEVILARSPLYSTPPALLRMFQSPFNLAMVILPGSMMIIFIAFPYYSFR